MERLERTKGHGDRLEQNTRTYEKHHNEIYYLYANIKIKEGNTSKFLPIGSLTPQTDLC